MQCRKPNFDSKSRDIFIKSLTEGTAMCNGESVIHKISNVSDTTEETVFFTIPKENAKSEKLFPVAKNLK